MIINNKIEMPYPHVFSPIRVGEKHARNRVMRLATLTNTIQKGQVTNATLALYRRIARGGSGIVVTEGMRIHPSSTGHGHSMQLYVPGTIDSVRRLARTVQEEGALVIAQLNHNGRQHHGTGFPTLWAPSAIPCPRSGGMPHAMTAEEIEEVIEGFVNGALLVREAGGDGIELHGAQGHLIQQFVSPFSNQRTDAYGGSFENRLRFPMEMMRRIRERAGSDFILGYRLGVEEFTEGGLGIEDTREITRVFASSGLVDFLSLTQGNFNTLDTHCPDSHYAPAGYADLHAAIKAVAGTIPVVATARIQTPEQAERILAEGKADMVGMCRALVADPEWPEKAMKGEAVEIRRCIYTCGCWGSGKAIACTVNPTMGRELELPPIEKALTRRKVVVIGGGAAGMEAAWVAAKRGHEVTLLEAAARLGGKLAGAERFTEYHEAALATQFLSARLPRAGVEVKLGCSADINMLRSLSPDALIVATGSRPTVPALATDGSVPVHAFDASIPGNLPTGHWIVMDQDGYYWPAALTEFLARQGNKVTYVTRFMQPFREIPEVARMSLLRSLDQRGVTLVDNAVIAKIAEGDVILHRYYHADHPLVLGGIAGIVWTGVQKISPLADAIVAGGFPEIHVVGDAKAPRRLSHAIAEGHKAGRAV